MEGARAVHLWGPLGWQEIRKRYRRSILGPFCSKPPFAYFGIKFPTFNP